MTANKLMILASLGVGFLARGDVFVARESVLSLPAPVPQATPDPRPLRVSATEPAQPLGAPGPAMPAVADEQREATSIDAQPSAPVEETVAPAAGHIDPDDEEAHAFATAVLELSAEADTIDRVWRAYGSGCQVSVGRSYDFGREWFALWDQAIQSRATSAGCAEMLQWLVDHGEMVRRDLASTLSAARRARLPAETVEGMIRWHALEWRP